MANSTISIVLKTFLGFISLRSILIPLFFDLKEESVKIKFNKTTGIFEKNSKKKLNKHGRISVIIACIITVLTIGVLMFAHDQDNSLI